MATAAGRAVGVPNFLDRMDPDKPLARRRSFVLRIMRQAMKARQRRSILCCSDGSASIKDSMKAVARHMFGVISEVIFHYCQQRLTLLNVMHDDFQRTFCRVLPCVHARN